jgi:hypothetical protein
LVDWQGLHQYHYLHQGSRISDFDIGRGDMMVKQKTKSASRKVSGAEAKTGSAVPGTQKIAKTAASATAKKAAEKKAPVAAAAAAAKKPNTPAVKRVSASAAHTTTPAKKAATSETKPAATANKATAQPSPEERYRMVETAAYFIAEQHGFQGRSDEHWAAAEREIAARLGAIAAQ